MLWETSVQIVHDEVTDDGNPGWVSTAGSPKVTLLCLAPFRPKARQQPTEGKACRYSRVADRGNRVERTRLCTSDFGRTSVTQISGIETSDWFDLRLITDLRDSEGRLLKQTVILEAGRKLGECPPGMQVHVPEAG